MKLYFVFIVLYLSKSFDLVYSRANGPPTIACQSMSPRHGNLAAQTENNPYTITTDVQVYNPSQLVTVTVNAVAVAYKGIFIQARVSPNEPPVGSWVAPENSDFKLIACSTPSGAIGHANNNNKTLPQKFQWIAPTNANGIGDITFFMSVVFNFELFFIQISSPTITFNETFAPPTTTTQSMVNVMTTSPNRSPSPHRGELMLLIKCGVLYIALCGYLL